MKRALLLAASAALLAAPVAAPAFLAAHAQSAGSTYQAPRTPFGQPDLSGYWQNSTLTPMTRRPGLGERLAYTEEEAAQLEQAAAQELAEGDEPTDPDAPAEYRQEVTNQRPEFAAAGGAVGGYNSGWLDPGSRIMRVDGQPRTSLITTPNGMPPARKAQPAAAQRPAAGGPPRDSFDSYETRSLGERCVISFGRNGGPPMFPNGFYNNNYHIVQTPDAVMIEVEMNHDARIVRLNGKHRQGDVRPYFGDSIGRWEGDTLVVETINIPRSQAFMGAWENLKVTERFRRVGEDRLYYAFTVEDPTVWDAPWGGEYEFHPMDGRMYEYACHEGNYSLPGILAGARVQEAAAAAAPAKKK